MRRGGVLGLLLAMVVLLFLSQAAISVGGGEAQREPFHPLMETAVRLREASERFWAELQFAWERAWEPVWRAFSPVVWAGGGRLCERAWRGCAPFPAVQRECPRW